MSAVTVNIVEIMQEAENVNIVEIMQEAENDPNTELTAKLAEKLSKEIPVDQQDAIFTDILESLNDFDADDDDFDEIIDELETWCESAGIDLVTE
jgi:putative heme iron utilization protein